MEIYGDGTQMLEGMLQIAIWRRYMEIVLWSQRECSGIDWSVSYLPMFIVQDQGLAEIHGDGTQISSQHWWFRTIYEVLKGGRSSLWRFIPIAPQSGTRNVWFFSSSSPDSNYGCCPMALPTGHVYQRLFLVNLFWWIILHEGIEET